MPKETTHDTHTQEGSENADKEGLNLDQVHKDENEACNMSKKTDAADVKIAGTKTEKIAPLSKRTDDTPCASKTEKEDDTYKKTHDLFILLDPKRLFLRCAIPGALSMLTSAIYEIADGIFVGQLLGEEAFAAVNLAMPFVIMLFAFGDMVGVGSSVPISISLGEGKNDRANNIFTVGVLLILLGASVIGAIFWFLAPWLMALMGAEGTLQSMAVDYLRMFALFAPFGTILFAVDNYLRICGKVKSSFALNAFVSTIGCILEFWFLSTLGLGTLGAGLAFSLAISLGAIAALMPFLFKMLLLRFVRPQFSWALLKEIMMSGTPAFLNDVAGRITLIFLNVELMAQGGITAVTVYGCLGFAAAFIFPLMYGTCDALQPAVGYNWGARRYDRIKQIEKYIFATLAAMSLVFSCIMGFFPELCVHIFIADAQENVLIMAQDAFRFYAVAYLFRWVSLGVQSLLIAVEKTKLASMLSFLIVTVLPLSVLFVLKPLGLMGLWLNAPISMVLAGAISIWILIGFRKELHLMEKRYTTI